MRKITVHLLVVAFTLLLSAQANAQDVIDLTAVNNPDILADTLPDLTSGSIVLLKPGMTYNAGGYAFDKSLTLQNSEPSNLNRPKINVAENFNFGDGATVDSIVFRNLEISGSYADHYAVNSNVAATIGILKFEGCYIHDLRGIVRNKDVGPGSINDYILEDCMITMIRDYGILTVDVNTWAVNNIVLRNSTVTKTRGFITSKNNSETVTIEGCTFSETPAAGQRMFRWREGGQDNVTGGIMVKNTLWGTGWDEESSGSTAYDGYDGLGTTTWNFENTYVTKDLDIADGADSIVGFNVVYDGLSSDLWLNPASGNLHYADTTFDGIGNAGDQRWAIATADGALEWNMSAAAYKYLGTIEATEKVAGLKIHAASDKTVVIDALQIPK